MVVRNGTCPKLPYVSSCIYFAVYTIYIYIHITCMTQYQYIFIYVEIQRHEFPSDVQMKPLCKLVSLRSSFDLFDASICI